MERITAIFMYQMEKKYSRKIRWRIVHKALEFLKNMIIESQVLKK